MGNISGNIKQPLFTRRFLLFIVSIYLIINFSGLMVPVVENACKYAQVSREIIDNGDWLNLTIAHEPYEQKPPLLFWIGAVFYSFLGVSFITFKLPVLLLSALGIYSTYRFARLLYRNRAGALAAFFYATSLGYFYYHNDIHTDTVLVNFVILAIWQLTAFFREKKWHQFLLGSIGVGLAMLSKGPIGLAIPVFALGTHLAATRRFREIFHVRWLLAAVLILIIISPALAGLYKEFGIGGIKFFFWTNNVGRVTGSLRSSNSGVFYYFHNLILMTSPWFVFVYAGLILEIRKYVLKLFRKEKMDGSDELINIGGIVLYFVVLTIASQKNPHYLMAVLPLTMVLAAKWTLAIFDESRFPKLKRVLTVINHIFPFLIWPLVLVFLLLFFPEKRGWFWGLFIAGTIGFILAYIKMKGLRKQLAILLLAQFVFFISLNTSILPSMLRYYSSFNACRVFNKQAEAGARLNSYRLRYWSIFYYSKSYGIWSRDDASLKKIVAEKGSWIFTDRTGLDVLNNWNVPYTLKGEFNNRNLTGQSFKFLNPKTRSAHMEKHYLVELGK